MIHDPGRSTGPLRCSSTVAQKRDDFALVHLEFDPVQDVALAVVGVQVLGVEGAVAHAAFPR
jgi:hypothetical protein